MVRFKNAVHHIMKKTSFQALLLSPVTHAVIWCTGLYCYILFRIDSSLHYVMQEPVFKYGGRFWAGHLSYPGGIVDYCAEFLSQFFVFPIAGAAIIVALILIISLSTWQIANVAAGRKTDGLLYLFPSVFLLMLHSNYNHPLSVTIGFALALISTYIYIRHVMILGTALRVAMFSGMAGLIFFFAAGNVLLFILLSTISEAAVRRRYLLCALFLVIGAAIPFIAQKFLFLVSMKDAYFGCTPFFNVEYTPAIAPWLLYTFLPICFVVSKFIPNSGVSKTAALHPTRTFATITVVIAGVCLIGVTVIAVTHSYNPIDNYTLRLCLLCREHAWDDILTKAAKNPVTNLYTSNAVAQALYYTGCMETSLFAYPQNFSANGLYLFPTGSSSNVGDLFLFSYRSDLYFNLGLVNSAEQWGYEAVATCGETLHMLERLALVHALKNESEAAHMCLSILASMPLGRKKAEEIRRRIAETSFSSDREMRNIKASLPVEDFIVQSVGRPWLDVERQIQQRPTARMSREYCIASYLLNGQLREAAAFIGVDSTTYVFAMPPLFQEALLLHMVIDSTAKRIPIDQFGPDVVHSFNEFNMIMDQRGSTPEEKVKKLTDKYRKTYWYYYLLLQERTQRDEG